MLFSSNSRKRIRVLLANKLDQGQIHGFNIDLPRRDAVLAAEDLKRMTWEKAQTQRLVDDTPDNWRFVVIDF